MTGFVSWLLLFRFYPSLEISILVSLISVSSFLGLSSVYALIGPISADRSVTAHLLIHMVQSPNRSISIKDLTSKYNDNLIIQKRFKELDDVGAITRFANHMEVTYKGVVIAKIFLFLIRILKLQKNY